MLTTTNLNGGRQSYQRHASIPTRAVAVAVVVAASAVVASLDMDYLSVRTAYAEGVAKTSKTNFKIQAALEFKEEMQKVKLARFLNELTKLAVQETAKRQRRRVTEIVSPTGEHMLSLDHVDLERKLDAEKAYGLIEKIHSGVELDAKSLTKLCQAAAKVLRKEASLVDKRGVEKVTVVGDLHGCLTSLKHVLKFAGDLSDPSRVVVFGGDFVDRGKYSLEVLCTLLLLKLTYPDQVVLVRGNHEDSMIASVYGFSDEIKQKYHLQSSPTSFDALWKVICATFAALPLAVVTDTAFIVHGGLPSAEFEMKDVQQVSGNFRCKLDTVVEPKSPLEKLVEGLMWSDPSPEQGIREGPRGTGVEFGPDVAKSFLRREDLKYVVRCHQPVEHGTERMPCGNDKHVVTVFSAADYPNGEGTNTGAIVYLDSKGSCDPIEFTFKGNQVKSGEAGLGDLWHMVEEAENTILSFLMPKQTPEDSLRQYISKHSDELVRQFLAVEKDSSVSKEQWISIMQEVLDLRDVSWSDLQPRLAPATAGEGPGDRIDWRECMIKNTTGIGAALADSQMSALVDHKDQCLAIFEFLDVDRNGVVDRAEFRAGVNILNSNHLPPDRRIRDPDAVFDLFDEDGSGDIDVSEFRHLLSQSALLSDVTKTIGKYQAGILKRNHDMLRTAFKFLDRDGSGEIDFDEFRIGIDLLNKQLQGEGGQLRDAKELFDLLDADGSGSISLDEFSQIFDSI